MIERTPSAGGFEDIAGYCRATRAGASISVSGTIAAPSEGATLADLDTYEQTSNALSIADASVRQLGGETTTVTRSRLYLSPGAVWQQAAKAHKDFFDDARPANTTIYVSALIPAGALVEVELEALASADGSS